MDGVINFIKENQKKLIYYALGLSAIALIRRYFNGPSATPRSVKDKVIIITGASEGMGKFCAEQLLRNGATVIFACRNETKTLAIINSLKEYKDRAVFMKLDQSSFKSIKDFITEFKSKFNRLDILMNNAGGVFSSHTLTEDGNEMTFQVNTFAPILLSEGLLDILNKSDGKIVNIGSKSHTRFTLYKDDYNKMIDINWDFNKNSYSIYKQYCLSKIGPVMFNQYLTEYIRQNRLNVDTYCLHPGTVRTEIVKNPKHKIILYLLYPLIWLITKNLEKGCQTALYLCYEDKEKLKSGEYYQDCGLKEVASHCDWKETELRDLCMDFCRVHIGKSNVLNFEIKVKRNI